MAAVGLVDDLTAATARRVALSAGARIEAVWSGRLGQAETRQIARQAPDVLLFAGGTDGGERERVLSNARAVADARSGAAIVVACNREVASAVSRLFERSGHDVVVVANVLPSIDREAPQPAREAIRELFIDRVVRGKGLSRRAAFFDSVVMPSPAAVLGAAELLADGSPAFAGIGSAVIVDVGGATTDVHSVIVPTRVSPSFGRSSPPPARSARTVEGDLGVRSNADAVCAQDLQWIQSQLGLAVSELEGAARSRQATPAFVPETDAEREIDRALATSCFMLALRRHVGRLSTRYVPGEGAEVTIDGRDLRDVMVVIATGGSIVHSQRAEEIVTAALSRIEPSHPAPRSAGIVIDQSYIAAAAGLLATVDPDAAFRLLLAELPGLRAFVSG